MPDEELTTLSGDLPPINLLLETGQDGGALLYSVNPPGLAGWGASVETAMAAAADRGWEELAAMAIAADRRWADLRRTIGATGPGPEFVIREAVQRRGAVANGMTTATFQADLTPLDRAAVQAALALLERSRARLLSIRGILLEQPDSGQAALAFRSLPRRKTIAEQLKHIAAAERWYIGKISPGLPPLPATRDIWQRLETVRGLVVARLAALDGPALNAATKINGERWTPRKVLRRLMYHEQFHLDTLRRDLSLAGAPLRDEQPYLS